ncbi:hypothetical protein JJE66_26570 [Bradyrhizobium diazoefficiens]|uniref:DUF5681 domain-containing protein n=1 Tax=Bradyrhizobium diazoefficiens TaxID=1355477 RepID=UPI00190D5EA1|nr:DUF5681 domain-containing protein [Bradyrhizobium diazoefficiens]MBK3664778.1 hypothetical protein [Bradyrhizobium diazoefficiens]
MKRQTRSSQSTDYEVGYGKPPKSTRFRKGQRYNPRARKKPGENFITGFKRYVSRTVNVTLDGVKKRMTTAEVVILRNIMAALKHNPAAMGNILMLAEVCGEFEDWTNPDVVGRPIGVVEKFESTEELLAFYGVEVVEMPSIHKKADV